MAEPFLGEVKLVAWNYAPPGWMLCDGSILPIASNQALASLLGTTFGGDGRTTFALPDLRGRVPVHPDGTYVPEQGAKGGSETVVLETDELPPHSHQACASTSGADYIQAIDNLLGDLAMAAVPRPIYAGLENTTSFQPPQNGQALNPESVSSVGGGIAHENMQPSLVINYIIASSGYYPQRP